MRHVRALLLCSASLMLPISGAHADAPNAPGYAIEELTDAAFDAPRGLILDADGSAYTFEHLTGEVF